jgi:hypothetical protein
MGELASAYRIVIGYPDDLSGAWKFVDWWVFQ